MAIYYVDHVGGNDSNNGTSFALRKKTINSATNTATAGDEVRVMGTPITNTGRVADWTSGPAVNTNLGSITGVSLTNPAILTFASSHGLETGDFIRTGYINLGVLNGYWEVTKINSLQVSIPISLVGYGAYTNNGLGRVFKANNIRVTIDSPMTQDICLNGQFGLPNKDDDSGRAWTASTNVSVSNSFYSGSTDLNIPHTSMFYVTIAPTANFTTGKAAYATLSSIKNLSGYQQISFWFRQTSGTASQQSGLSIKLCSDTLGDTVVNSFVIPGSGISNHWQPITLDFGSPLGSSINSIALYVDVDLGAVTWEFQGFIAVKGKNDPDGFLSYTSLITSGREGDIYYPVRMIQKNNIIIDTSRTFSDSLTMTPNNWRGYNYLDASNHTSIKTYTKETGIPFFVVNPIDISKTYVNYVYRASATNTILDQIGTQNGTLTPTNDAPITISGGWNTTDMSTKDHLYTFFQSNGYGRITVNTKTNIVLKNLGMVRSSNGFFSSYGNHIIVENCVGGICNGPPFYADYTDAVLYKNCLGFYNTYQRSFFSYNVFGLNIEGCKSINGLGGIYPYFSSEICVTDLTVKNSDNQANYYLDCSDIEMYNCSYINCAGTVHYLTDGIYSFKSCKETVTNAQTLLGYSTAQTVPIASVSFVDLTETNVSYPAHLEGSSSSRIPRQDDLNPTRISYLDGKQISYGRNYQLEKSLTYFRTSSPCIKLTSPNSSFQTVGNTSVGAPYYAPLAKIAVKSTGTVTFSAWISSGATPSTNGTHNIGLIAWLPELGLSQPVRSNIINPTSSYQQATLEFTPTKAGVVEVFIESFNINFHSSPAGLYIDDISVTQV